ncbi:hypothetical protein [Pseudomonas entomophila]|uniref:Uncharacterized protein n=2 Tax=Pseudomonas entomophila TaxID=312306 RepID=Q1IBN5_PSEE4|nr:hypothetical protein [Pseudomonas entomophila]WMW04284.1 hypothetical protein RAH46_18340 [Pseudomonas entomophila]CAK14930.1 hypothetical protein; putative signal peptide [Pseudomonas entomophila L48]
MQKIALIALLATTGMTQVAYGSSAVLVGTIDTAFVVLPALGQVSSIPCPEGTYMTPVGLCQPDFDFD